MDAAVKVDVSNSTLGPTRERRLLDELADCKRKLAEAFARGSAEADAAESDDPLAVSRWIVAHHAKHGPVEGPLEAVFRRYFELRAELTLANMRLVASIAKRYVNRGVAYTDLLQEGSCGLLEAIDRFDPSHQTKLTTYATWWIRQAIQCAVAAGAYPVRLTPRHLRQLARNQEEQDRENAPHSGRQHVAPESVRRIRSATRPAVSLDEIGLIPSDARRDPEGDLADGVDLDAAVGEWMVSLRPRERQVLSYRFGLGGSPRLSLSQVGKVLDVSKERVRQIENAALEMLRKSVSRYDLMNFN
ncbi:sigma-70 family RNA polymerase sigma factor [Aquisphaera insulae]|uniref:sigma-70 family RNA polymerase sigma factor n=1 Tax=Aquisphaera insulae TaxID=2712864 RepID=UPI0013EBAE39|nr:sigma-70 family RNA polymerase sigma factor [Aquisphaera insulae]